MKADQVLMCYTADELEQPVAVADTAKEMCMILQTSKQNMSAAIKKNRTIKYTNNQLVKVQWVAM